MRLHLARPKRARYRAEVNRRRRSGSVGEGCARDGSLVVGMANLGSMNAVCALLRRKCADKESDVRATGQASEAARSRVSEMEPPFHAVRALPQDFSSTLALSLRLPERCRLASPDEESLGAVVTALEMATTAVGHAHSSRDTACTAFAQDTSNQKAAGAELEGAQAIQAAARRSQERLTCDARAVLGAMERADCAHNAARNVEQQTAADLRAASVAVARAQSKLSAAQSAFVAQNRHAVADSEEAASRAMAHFECAQSENQQASYRAENSVRALQAAEADAAEAHAAADAAHVAFEAADD